jgi:hypothetical protein
VAATFYESQEEDNEQVDNVQDSDQADQVTQEQEQEAPQVEQEPEEDLPSKYKNKSLSEIIKMHQEAEKLIGRQAQEVGEVRKLADELIKRQLHTPKQEEVKATKEDEIDYFADPDTAVAKKIEKHPAILEVKEQARQLKEMQTITRLQKEFPNYQEIVTDPDFADWVKASSIRLSLFAKAHSEFDFDSAAELLSTWKYIKPQPVKQEVSAEVKQQQKAAVKQATVDVGGATQAVSSTKIYRRADLIRLQLEDPSRYEQLQPEIMAAYAEGRVK